MKYIIVACLVVGVFAFISGVAAFFIVEVPKATALSVLAIGIIMIMANRYPLYKTKL